MPFMQGLDAKSIKKHPSLIPLYAVLIFGCSCAALYLGRLAIKNPDVSWNLKTKPEPWNDYKDKTYKLLSPAEGRKEPKRMRSVWDF